MIAPLQRILDPFPPPRPSMLKHAFLLGPLLLAGCDISWGKSYPEVNGVRLKSKHQETLELVSLPAEGLAIESALGDVRVLLEQGPTRLEVEVYETAVGDAHARVENGELVASSTSGREAAIGAATLRTDQPLTRLEIRTEIGDIEVRQVRVVQALILSTGMGDITVGGVGELDSIAASSGMGDVKTSETRCGSIEISTGMGDVEVFSVSASKASLSSGMGDLRLERSDFETLKASTGIGDIDCIETSYRGELESGLGEVRKKAPSGAAEPGR